MGIMDKIKRATGTDEQYDDIYDNEYYDGFDDYGDAGMDAQTQQVNMNQTQQGYAAPTGTGGMTGSAYTPAAYSPAAGTSAGVFSSSTGGISLSGSAIEMKVVKPEHFESVPQIADHLLNKRTVVLNLENTNKETALPFRSRLLDRRFSQEDRVQRLCHHSLECRCRRRSAPRGQPSSASQGGD